MRKYIWYALGEILLVVIGILIALQINNLNENRKEKNYELRMLTELSVALVNDIDNFRLFEDLISGWEESIFYLTDASNMEDRSSLDIDSLRHHLDSIWGFGVYIAYNDGPYEALKSSGLDKISNDSLRNEIVNLYSFAFPSLDVWINEIIRGSIEAKFRHFDLLFDLHVERNGQTLEKELIVENLDFLDSPIFADILNKSSNATKGSKTPIVQNRRRMEQLLKLINEELNNHSN
tara:strand:- start:4687 stop:5391 length:705 start_codon:yes stop_codon:yes gene_type:complete